MIDVQSGARAFDAALARANATVQREAPSDEWRIVDARCRCGRFARVTAASFRQTTIGPYIRQLRRAGPSGRDDQSLAAR
jgi:hypothetical protein